ncbi:MAG TPA: patatin-like phospholipase family protein [Patescibacteria group bacterium]|nr:patatin-like phospholipase family protein [Patescibacteria group bacterium]
MPAAKGEKKIRTAKRVRKPGRKIVNLALQGGGAHGAFTWGVLDALLEDDRIDIEGISATSAGAMNAAVMAQGLNAGGTAKARELLEEFWRRIAQAGVLYSPVQSVASQVANAVNPFLGGIRVNENPGFAMFETMTSFVSPYQFNPLNINPLRPILEELLDFRVLRNSSSVKLFVSATCVRTGVGRIFMNKDLSVDCLLASAALPYLFQAVKIGRDFYWDGGYSGNPALYPLFYEADSRDILIVHVNPIERAELPDDSASIDNRLNEITFNASLLDELRAISFAKRLIVEGWLKDKYKDRLRNILIHSIRADKALKDLSVASKFDTNWDFLIELRDMGRSEGRNWIDRNYDAINKRDTVDIRKDYLDITPGG